MKRGHGQAPHDRYILHYRPGMELPVAWRNSSPKLQGELYQSFLQKDARAAKIHPNDGMVLRLAGLFRFTPLRCAAQAGNTYFLFNTEDDWEENWGGQILMMDDGGRYKPHSAPNLRI